MASLIKGENIMKSNIVTGVALKVTSNNGRVSYPCYEAYGWDKVNAIIAATYAIDHVALVEIVDVNIKAAA